MHLNEDLYNLIYDMRVNQGMTSKEIANCLGKSVSGVENYMYRNKIYKIPINDVGKKVKDLISAGVTPKEVSETLDISMGRVYYYIRKAMKNDE